MKIQRKPRQRPLLYDCRLLLAILILVMPYLVSCVVASDEPYGGAIYYVSASSGHDQNDGQSPADAFRTIAKATESVRPGDVVYILAGTYFEQLAPVHSGHPDRWITYAAFPGDTVILDGTGTGVAGEWEGMVQVKFVHYNLIEGLQIVNSDGVGVMIDAASKIILRNCATTNTWSSGIGVWAASAVRLENNQVRLANNGGPNECITIAQTHNFVVQNNTVSDPAPNNLYSGEGIDVKNGSSNGKVIANTVTDITDNIGIYIDSYGHTRNITIADNTITNCLIGIAVASEAGEMVENILVTGNRLIDLIDFGVIIPIWAKNGPRHNIQIVGNRIANTGIRQARWYKDIEVEFGANVSALVIEENQIMP